MSELRTPLEYLCEPGDASGPGLGQDVVFVHGFPDGPSVWEVSARHLRKRGFRVIRVTLPGFEEEGEDQSPQSFEALGERLYLTLKACDALGATLIGHDWGAILVYQMLRHHPEAVSRVVTIEIGAGPRTPWLVLFVLAYHALLIFAHWLGAPRGDWLMQRFCACLRRPSYAGAPRAKARHAWLYRQAWREGSREGPWLFYYRNLIARWRPHPEVPTLFLYGSETSTLFRFHSKAWRRELTRASALNRVSTLPGAHWCFLEAPEAFHAALDDFLQAEVSTSTRG